MAWRLFVDGEFAAEVPFEVTARELAWVWEARGLRVEVEEF